MEPTKRNIIDNAFRATWVRFSVILQDIDIDLINESTFRFFYIEELLRLDKTIKLQIEWQKVDLLVQFGNRNILVEFKFYIHKHTIDLSLIQRGPKGGAGDKNFGEFDQCIKTLQNFKDKFNSGEIHERYIVLVYQNKFYSKLKQTDFHSYYSNIGIHLDELMQEKYSLHGSLVEIFPAPNIV